MKQFSLQILKVSGNLKVSGQFPDGQFRKRQYPERAIPERTFPRRTVPQMAIPRTVISPYTYFILIVKKRIIWTK